MWFELIGYIASALVALSLTMSRIFTLRLLNSLGALTFIIYGFLIDALPIVLTNILILGINLYYLYQMQTTSEYFQLLYVRPDSEYLQKFLDFYNDDINKIVPDFAYDPLQPTLVVFILRDLRPVGVFIGRQEGDTVHLILDYVIPGYRDFKAGRFIYHDNRNLFLERDIKTLVSDPGYPIHEKYLQKCGFTLMENGQYIRQLAP